jgi:hypothetical protein
VSRLALAAIAGLFGGLSTSVNGQTLVIELPATPQARHASAQSGTPDSALNDHALELFLREVRRGTAQYAQPRQAVRAGYRRIGGRFPAMGEHWVHPGVVMRGRFDPAEPAILIYGELAGKPSLIGVAFAIPLRPGDTPPLVAGAPREWHEHNGSVADESVFGGHHHRTMASSETRLAILHVWTELPNPAGTFATDNWSLPFATVGLRAPAAIPENAARALSLATGAAGYYLTVLDLRDSERFLVSARLKEVEQRVQRMVAAARAEGELRPDDLVALEAMWVDAVRSLEDTLGGRVAPLRGR